jgi:hypothetical protein
VWLRSAVRKGAEKQGTTRKIKMDEISFFAIRLASQPCRDSSRNPMRACWAVPVASLLISITRSLMTEYLNFPSPTPTSPLPGFYSAKHHVISTHSSLSTSFSSLFPFLSLCLTLFSKISILSCVYSTENPLLPQKFRVSSLSIYYPMSLPPTLPPSSAHPPLPTLLCPPSPKASTSSKQTNK